MKGKKKCQSHPDAMQLNHYILTKRLLADWNSMIQTSTRNGFFSESLDIYSSMLRAGVRGDNFTFPSVAKACGKLNLLGRGKMIHAHIVLLGFQHHVVVQTALIDMYSKCSDLASSCQVFEEMPTRNLVSWNSMISTYSRHSQIDESLGIFKEMRARGFEPNSSTFVNIVSGCCGSSWVLRQGLSVQCCAIKLGLDSDLLLSNSIMSMYVRFDRVTVARSLFNSMDEKSNVSWTTIIGGYLKLRDFSEAFNLFDQMRRKQVSLDSITFVNLIYSCAEIGTLSLGSSVHALVVKCGCEHEEIIANSIVSMYVKCGDLVAARRTFDSMHEKGLVLWTSMIGGYVHCGHANEALTLFQSLLTTTLKPNEVTIAIVLSACADSGCLSVGEKIEEYANFSGFQSDLRVQTSLIHMYCKCGWIERARGIFDEVSNKDLAVWGSMINGYAMHGKGEEALFLFERMQREKQIVPDAIVFTGVLLACSHSGLVEDGLKYFVSMRRDFNIEPSIEHYSCLVDLLGRAGCLSLALKTIQDMPIKAQIRALVPLLSACRTHHQIQLAEFVVKRLFNLEPQNARNYKLMANIYASVGRWMEAAQMRGLINDRGLVKEPGWSMIQHDDSSHVVLPGDYSKSNCHDLQEVGRVE